jgi:ribonuclease P protein component
MKRRVRLRGRGEIQLVLRSRRVHVGPAMVAYARPASSEGRLRVAVAISRNVRGAVRRNRVRRRLREAARAGLLGGDSDARDLGIAYDVVVIARPAALDMAFSELVAEMEAVRRRLAHGAPGR